jgi:hypothetical protein
MNVKEQQKEKKEKQNNPYRTCTYAKQTSLGPGQK